MVRARVVLLAAAVVATLALAGCGSGTSRRDAAGPPASTPTTSGPAAGTTEPGVPSGAASAKRAVPPTLAFTAKTLDGADFDAASLAGKPVVLWFWAPWCPTCRAAGPHVAQTAARYAGRVSVVGVAGLSDDTASMRQFVAATNTAGFVHLSDGAGSVWKRFRVATQDTYVLIAADGSLNYTGPLGAADLTARVGALAG